MTALFVLGGGAARATDWTATPSARLAAEYVKNPLLVPSNDRNYTDSTGDGIADLSGDISRHAANYDLVVAPRAFFSRYVNRSVFDHDDQYLNLNGDLKSERSQWQGSVAAARDTALTSEVGVTGITDTNIRHENLNVSGGPSYQLSERLTLAANAGWLASHYVGAGNSGLIDYRYGNGETSLKYALTERTQAGLDASGGSLSSSIAAQRHESNYALQATLTRYLTEQWTLNLAGGPSRAEFGNGNHASGAVYSAALTHQGELYDVNLKISREITPTGRGSLTRDDRAVASLSGSITERLSTESTLQYAHTRDFRDSSPLGSYNLHYYMMQEVLRWKLTPYWTLDLTAQLQHQSTVVIPLPGVNVSGNRVGLGLTWSGLPHRL